MFNRVLSIVIIVLIVTQVITQSFSQSFSQDTNHTPLVEGDELVLMSFAVENSAKIFTMATAKDGSYIIHRFGDADNIEFEFPAKNEDSWNQFVYSHYSRAVGNSNALLDLNYLEFTSGNSRYFIYDSFSEEFIKSFVGVTVIDLSTGAETNLPALDQAKIGNLSQLLLTSKVRSQSALKAKVPSTPGKTIEFAGTSSNESALAALKEELAKFEAEVTNSVTSSQQALSRVEQAFNQLIADTLNTQTNIAYWTVENEEQLETVRARARTIASNQQAVNELVTQFETANAIESKTVYLSDISAYSETIKALNSELELLESSTIDGFNDSRSIYQRRIQNNSNNDQNSDLENPQDNT